MTHPEHEAAPTASPLAPRLLDALEDLFGLPRAELHAGAELEADLALDSLSVVELQVALEEAFATRIDVEDAAAVRTLGDLQAVLDEAVARARGRAPVLSLVEPDHEGRP